MKDQDRDIATFQPQLCSRTPGQVQPEMDRGRQETELFLSLSYHYWSWSYYSSSLPYHHLQLVVAGCLNILFCCEGSSTGNEKVHVHVVVDTVANVHVVAISVVLIVVVVVVVVVLVGIVDNVGGHCGGNNASGEIAPDRASATT